MTHFRTVAAGSAVAIALLGSFVPAGAGQPSAGTGCQGDRRTTVYAQGKELGKGTWVPCVIDTKITSGESGLQIDTKGTLIRGVATDPVGIAVSADNGKTWKHRAMPDGTTASEGDGYLDPVTGRYFYTEAGNTDLRYTDDLGKTWGRGTFDSTQRQDWPRVFSGRPLKARAKGYPTNVYYCNWVAPLGVVSPTVCQKSVDGGRTFVSLGDPVFNIQACSNPTAFPSPNHGRGIVDPRNGTIYLVGAVCGHLDVAISKDEGKTWVHRVIPGSQSQYTYVQPIIDTATNVPFIQGNLTGKPNPVAAYLQSTGLVDNLKMDGRGNLYAAWIAAGTYKTTISSSRDAALTWSTPVQVTPPSVNHTVAPSIAVTKEGRVGVSYNGTTDKGATWTGYLTVVDDLGKRGQRVQTASVTRPGKPLITEPCCWSNGTQEWTEVRWAPDGTLWSAFFGSRPSGDAEGFVGHLVPQP